MHKLVPNVCLLTIIAPPTTDDPPVSNCGASVEQLTTVPPVVSHIAVKLTHFYYHDMVTEQPCGVDVPHISEGIGLPNSSSALLDASIAVEQSTSILPEARQQELVLESEVNTKVLSRDHELPSGEALVDAEMGSFIDLPSPLVDHSRGIYIY